MTEIESMMEGMDDFGKKVNSNLNKMSKSAGLGGSNKRRRGGGSDDENDDY